MKSLLYISVGKITAKEGKRSPLGKEMPTSERGSKFLAVTLRSIHQVPVLEVQQRLHAALAAGCSPGKSSLGSSAHISFSLL